MKLRASGEDYLETILVLHKKTGMVRSVDVANPFCCLPSLRDTYWRTALMLIILLKLHWMVLRTRN